MNPTEEVVPSFEDRVEQLCSVFSGTAEISSLKRFLDARTRERLSNKDTPYIKRTTSAASSLGAHDDGNGRISAHSSYTQSPIPEPLPPSGLAEETNQFRILNIYRAWAHIFREALAVKHQSLLDSLISWLDDFGIDTPAGSPLGAVEVIRVYASLRTGLHSKVLSRQAQITTFDILGRQPLGPILPVMQTSLSALEVEEVIKNAFNVYGEGDITQFGTANLLSAVRSIAFEERVTSFGSYDKKLLVLKLRDRSMRSESYMALMSYMQAMERESSQVSELETRFGYVARAFIRQTSSFPPSLPTAYALYSEALKLSGSAAEFIYPQSLLVEIENVVNECRVVLDRALEATKATHLQMSSRHNITQRRNKSSGHQSQSREASLRMESANRLLSHLNSSTSQWMGTPMASMTGGVQPHRHAMIPRDPSALISSTSAGFHSSTSGGGRPSSTVPEEEELAFERRGSELIDPARNESRKYKPTSVDFDPDKYYTAPQGTKVAEVAGIWLQVDTNPESIALAQPDLVGDDEMTSKSYGTFRLYKNRLTWIMVNATVGPITGFGMSDSESVMTNDADRDNGNLNLNSVYDVEAKRGDPSDESVIRHYNSRYLGNTGGKRCNSSNARVCHVASPIARAFHRLLASHIGNEMGPQHIFQSEFPDGEELDPDALEEISESLYTIPLSALKNFTFGALDRSRSYLAIYTNTEVIKLFPFTKREITQLASAINEFTGLKSAVIGSHTDKGIQRTMENMRRRLHGSVAGQWITHTEELHRILINLTKDDSPIRMRDLERIYHSARHNKTIVKECIPILQEIWRCAKGQDTMLKVLAVVDRILDGDILHGDDVVLVQLLQWLHQIETGLDPYSHSRPLKLLLKVCHRAEYLQSQTILPLIETFYDDSVFEMPRVYDIYLRMHDK